MSNDGERVALLNRAGGVVDEVAYGIAAPWAVVEGGPSLERRDPLGASGDPGNWRRSADGGTPGVVNGADPTLTPVHQGVLESRDGATTVLQMPVQLSEPSDQPVTVGWSTIATLPSPGIAEPGADFVAASGDLLFEPGETEQIIEISILDDAVDEEPLLYGEWAFVLFNDPVGATVSSSFYNLGLVIIVDDD